MTTNMLHIHGDGFDRCRMAGWVSGWRRNDLSVSEQVEVEDGRSHHTATSQSRARTRAVSRADCPVAYGSADDRPRVSAVDLHRGQALLPTGSKANQSQQVR